MLAVDPLKDPTTFSIEEKRAVGLYPPSKDTIADSMYPYIKRLKPRKIKILEVGTGNGESAYRFLELDEENKKIEKFVTINLPVNSEIPEDELSNIARQNLKDKPVTMLADETFIRQEKFDVVYINADLKNLDIAVEKYYHYCDHNGIYCGNNHHTTHVKEALSKFRRKVKIGTPIQVSNRLCWFWWKR